VAPGTWSDFYTFLRTNADASPLPMVPIAYPVRLVMAVVLTAWGGLTNRRWTVPIAAGLAIPALYQLSYLPLWLGVIGIEWPLRLPHARRVIRLLPRWSLGQPSAVSARQPRPLGRG
jgi:hypothetical protein